MKADKSRVKALTSYKSFRSDGRILALWHQKTSNYNFFRINLRILAFGVKIQSTKFSESTGEYGYFAGAAAHQQGRGEKCSGKEVLHAHSPMTLDIIVFVSI